MTLLQLKYAVTVADTGSITAGDEAEYITKIMIYVAIETMTQSNYKKKPAFTHQRLSVKGMC